MNVLLNTNNDRASTGLVVNVFQEEDKLERVKEAVARTVAIGLMSEDVNADVNLWLNPTEVICIHHYILSF